MEHKNEGPARGQTATGLAEREIQEEPRLKKKSNKSDPATQQNSAAAPPLLAKARCVASIVTKPISWLWKSFIAQGKLTLLAGNPGLGKSQFSIYLAAIISNGGTFPDGRRAPEGEVLFINCEDDPGDTIRPRLEAAGANLKRVHVLDAISDRRDGADHDRPFQMRDYEALRHFIDTNESIKLVVIDPVSAFMGNVDSHKTADVRGALAPLTTLAMETGVAILLVTHLNKGSGDGNAMSRVTGSGAYVAASRAAFIIERDPDDQDGKRRVLAPLKNNLGDDTTAFAYHVESVTLPSGVSTSKIVFEGTSHHRACDLVSTQVEGREERSALAEAKEVLRELLKDGVVRAQTWIETETEKLEISKATLRRAKQALGIKSAKSPNTGSWTWQLPATPQDAQAAPPKSVEHVEHLEHVQQKQSVVTTALPEDAQGAQGNHSPGPAGLSEVWL